MSSDFFQITFCPITNELQSMPRLLVSDPSECIVLYINFALVSDNAERSVDFRMEIRNEVWRGSEATEAAASYRYRNERLWYKLERLWLYIRPTTFSMLLTIIIVGKLLFFFRTIGDNEIQTTPVERYSNRNTIK